MATYNITAPDGTSFKIDGEGGPPTEAELEQIYSYKQTAKSSGKFDLNDESQTSPISLSQRAQLSLASSPEQKMQASKTMNLESPSIDKSGNINVGGVPVSPKSEDLGQFIYNTPGMVADNLGNAITLGTQIAGDIAATPIVAASGGAALPAAMGINALSAAAGDTIRQSLNASINKADYDLAQTGIEAGLASTAPVLGKVANKLIKIPLQAAAKGMNKIISSSDKLNAAAGEKNLASSVMKLLNGVPPEATQRYFDRKIIDGVELLTPENTNPSKLSNIAKKTLLGLEENESIPADSKTRAIILSRQMEKMGAGGVDLYERIGGISPSITQRIVADGAAKVINSETMSPGFITNLGESVISGINSAIKKAGQDVGAARNALMSGKIVSPNLAIDLTPVNQSLASELNLAGMLKPVTETIDGKTVTGYIIDNGYKKFETGASQIKTFSTLMQDFFDKKTITARDVINEIDKKLRFAKGDELKNLLVQRNQASKLPNKTIFSIKKNMPFGELLSKLSRIEGQLSDREFEKMGDLKSVMSKFIGHIDNSTGELTGLRGLTVNTANRAGDTSFADANKRYMELMNISEPIKDALKSGNQNKIESFFNSLLKPSVSESRISQADMLERELISHGKPGFIDKLNAYNASKQLLSIAERPSHISDMVSSFEHILEGTLDTNKSILNRQLEIADSAIPDKNLRFMNKAKDAVVGKEFIKDPQNLFRMGRVGYILSLGRFGGPLGTLASLGAGYQITSPKSGGQAIVKALTSPAIQEFALRNSIPPVPNYVGIAGQKALQGIVDSNNRNKRNNRSR